MYHVNRFCTICHKSYPLQKFYFCGRYHGYCMDCHFKLEGKYQIARNPVYKFQENLTRRVEKLKAKGCTCPPEHLIELFNKDTKSKWKHVCNYETINKKQ